MNTPTLPELRAGLAAHSGPIWQAIFEWANAAEKGEGYLPSLAIDSAVADAVQAYARLALAERDAEVEMLRVDAERYRFLRRQVEERHPNYREIRFPDYPPYVCCTPLQDYYAPDQFWGAELDAEVDAAIDALRGSRVPDR